MLVLQRCVNRSHKFLSQKLTMILRQELIRIRQAWRAASKTRDFVRALTQNRAKIFCSSHANRRRLSSLKFSSLWASFTRFWLPSAVSSFRVSAVSLYLFLSLSLPRVITKTTRVIDVPSISRKDERRKNERVENDPPEGTYVASLRCSDP